MTSQYNESSILNDLTLGKTTEYQDQYDAGLLQPVPRSLNREQLSLPTHLPFYGEDLWTGYELSWLNSKGKPCVAIAEFFVPAVSDNLIESKSFKLYLNSFNQTRFASYEHVKETLINDLSKCANAPVRVELYSASEQSKFQVQALPGECIDELDVTIDQYQYDKNLLTIESPTVEPVSETLHSHLLKSNCLITNQPDWASVIIEYTGAKINHEALLKYLISFRSHNEFHEQCVERIYCDIVEHCKPSRLSVYARYTRRGGLDINPFRSSEDKAINADLRTHRQ